MQTGDGNRAKPSSSRRTLPRIALVLAAAGSVACGFLLLAYRDVLRELWTGVRVVRTWRDLQRQPGLDVGNGVTVRLGIEAREGPQLGGVLLYGLFEGIPADAVLTDRGSGLLGPLRVLVSSPGEEPRNLQEVLSVTSPMGGVGKLKQRLFARRIELSGPGAHRVEIRTRAGELLRSTTIKGSDATPHPWLRIRNRFAVLVRSDGREHRVEPDPAEVFLPSWTGIRPLGVEATRRALASPESSELPRLNPAEFRLELRQDPKRDLLFVLRTKTEELLDENQIPLRLVARWKINGRPFSPDPSQNIDWTPPQGPPERTERVNLEFRVAPRLPANPGDRITLQLMYSDRGYSRLGQSSSRTAVDDDLERIYLSQPIEFVLPP